MKISNIKRGTTKRLKEKLNYKEAELILVHLQEGITGKFATEVKIQKLAVTSVHTGMTDLDEPELNKLKGYYTTFIIDIYNKDLLTFTEQRIDTLVVYNKDKLHDITFDDNETYDII